MLKWVRVFNPIPRLRAIFTEKEIQMKAFITGDDTTGWTLTDANGLPISGYSRRRDAVRGATRRGFKVVGA